MKINDIPFQTIDWTAIPKIKYKGKYGTLCSQRRLDREALLAFHTKPYYQGFFQEEYLNIL